MIIYKTTNLINGKIYVGKDARSRPTYLGSGLILRKAIAKYGAENFKKETLETCSTLNKLNDREKYWIEHLKSNVNSIGYNLTTGGIGGDTYSHLDEVRRKNRIANLHKAAREFAQSDEGKAILSARSKKMWENPKHRDYMRSAMLGREIKWKHKISDSIKKWHKTNPISEEGKARIRIGALKNKGKQFKPIPVELHDRICDMYQIMGAKAIAEKLQNEGHDISRYLIIKLLKKLGIYQKWQKGIGEKSLKMASLSRRGNLNPMAKTLTNT